MEPMVFSFFAFLFWTPALFLFVIGLLSFKKKTLRKLLLTISLISFSIPLLMIIGTRIDGLITQKKFEGLYIGQDSLSHKVTVQIKDDESFVIMVDNCDDATIKGTYDYVREYDDFLFYADNCDVSLTENHMGEMFLCCNFNSSCAKLNKIKLNKK